MTTGELPAGAIFDPASREFRWTPVSNQAGDHEITFTAVDSSAAKSDAAVTVQVDSGQPVASAIVNAASRSTQTACAPGAIAAVQGRWLTGASGSKVWANGSPAAILSASETELTFVCPDAAPGSEIQVVVETDQGVAAAVQTTARLAAPGLFSLDGSGTGQALAVDEGTNQVAMISNARIASQPAAAGDRVLVYATGVDNLANVTVAVDGFEVVPTAIRAVPNQPGMFQVALSLPRGLDRNGDVPLILSGDTADGSHVSTNRVTISVRGDFR